VRTAGAEDVPALVRSIAAVAEERMWINTEPPVDETALRERFTLSIESESDFVLVADADGELIGDLGVQGVTPRRPPSFGMSVDARWRGRGVGSALLAEAIGRTRSMGAWKLWLEVFPHNEAAIALYRKFGFVEEGLLRAHYRRANGELWDVTVMGLPLT
jgi:RimJ/RimL family protein N-acetyltransferase